MRLFIHLYPLSHGKISKRQIICFLRILSANGTPKVLSNSLKCGSKLKVDFLREFVKTTGSSMHPYFFKFQQGECLVL